MVSKVQIQARNELVMNAIDHLALIASGLRKLDNMTDEELLEYRRSVADSTPELLELITHFVAARNEEREDARLEVGAT